jgi:hypothetical protein
VRSSSRSCTSTSTSSPGFRAAPCSAAISSGYCLRWLSEGTDVAVHARSTARPAAPR